MYRDELTSTRGKNPTTDEKNELGQTKRRAQAISEQANVEAMVMLISDEVIESFGGADELASTLESLLNKIRNTPGTQIQ